MLTNVKIGGNLRIRFTVSSAVEALTRKRISAKGVSLIKVILASVGAIGTLLDWLALCVPKAYVLSSLFQCASDTQPS